MKLKINIEQKMILYAKDSLKELVVDNSIKQVFDENSEEYKELCNMYGREIKFERKDFPNEYDQIVLKKASKHMQEVQKSTIEKIVEVIKTSFLKGNNSVVEFGGYIINPKDFCAIKVDKFNVNISKE